ncbi:MAG TPA: hypothetical protein VKK79_04870 [Candidatus Lokiarchaeia archaeon]|nr:hypothetical protein [Candidatus Lokiarchaeia archaeon]
MSLMFGTGVLGQIFAFFQFGAPSQQFAQQAFAISSILQVLAIFAYLLVLEVFEKNNPISGRITFFSAFVAVIIYATIHETGFYVENVNNNYIVSFQPDASVTFLQLVFGLLTGVWLVVTLYRSWKAAKVRAQKHLIAILVFGTILIRGVGDALPGFFNQLATGAIPQDILVVLTAIAEFFESIGMWLIGWGIFRVSKHPWLIQRQKVHLLLVINNDGLDLYSKTFSSDITQSEVTLLTGGVSAVSALFQEATKSPSQVQAVLFEGKELRILRRERFACAILVDYSTTASEAALLKFTEKFEEMFQDKISDFGGNVSQFRAADAIAEEYFS